MKMFKRLRKSWRNGGADVVAAMVPASIIFGALVYLIVLIERFPWR